SRSQEEWLAPEHCRRLQLGGLGGDELWGYGAAVIDALQLPVDRKDPELRDLLNELDGDPVLIQAVLAQLSGQSVARLRKQWREKLPAFLAQQKNPAQARLLASLELAFASFTKAEKDYLIPLALHERYLDLNYLHLMGKGIPNCERECLDGVVWRL